jgi:hypothetical protein
MPPTIRRILFALASVLLAARAAAAQDGAWSRPSHADSTRLLYKSYGYGSDAYNSPFTVQLNKGFDIFQLRNSPRNVWTFSYGNSWTYGIRGVWEYPGPAIERFGGWRRMLRVEILPLSWDKGNLNWFVNYTEHLLGGGLTMRMLDEWYAAHGFPLPRLWAVATTYSASILNEISEQPNVKITGSGGVADLMIFDVGAVTFFHFNQPTHFFATTLQAADWSNQAAFTFPNKQLQNNGQYITLKVPIGFQRTRLFLRGGMGAQLGISRKLADDEHHISVGVGGDTEVRDIDKAGHETVGFAPGAGVYYDRNNSLLWSLTTSPAENLVALNIYPNVVPSLGRDLGLWAVYTRRNELRFGVVSRHALGLGMGYGQ